MFTGLVAELGTVQKLAQQGESYHLTVAAVKVLQNLKIGDSVAVNGACLTVVSMDDTAFTADVMPETVRLTNIGSLHAGDRVNLERTLRLCDGLDGHIVSGHVEGLGVIAGRRPEGIASWRPLAPSADFVPSPVSELRAGQRIEHNRFGAGTIKQLSGTAPDVKAVISFDNFGEKILLLKYAKVRILE